jgi:hypothetical protein
MLLRNAYVCMNGSQAQPYFMLLPPTFEHWVSQGPNARPLPTNSIFHHDYVNRFADDSDEEDSDDDDD